MSRDALIVDGHAFSWKRLCELRRAQLEAERQARTTQPFLFEVKDDHRPISQRTGAGRYLAPTLPGLIQPD
jgi:hypothetical protein